MELLSTGNALLSTQKALLGVVFPELRAVVVDLIQEEDRFVIIIYYDGELEEQLIELLETIPSKANDYLGADVIITDEIVRLD